MWRRRSEAECADAVLCWLKRWARVRSGLCLLASHGAPWLEVAAAVGVAPERAQAFRVDLGRADDPLVRVLDRSEPVRLPAPGRGELWWPETPLGSGPLVALPMVLEDLTPRKVVGLVLADLDDVRVSQARRAARMLAVRVGAIRYQKARFEAEQLRARVAELTAARREDAVFLAGFSHELRTPLNAILGYAELIARNLGIEDPTRIARKLHRIDANARHLLALINDILEVSRAEASRQPLHLERFSVRDLIGEVARDAEVLLRGSGVVLRREIPAAVPDVVSDRIKVKQVLLNLVSNAVKFTPEGSVELRVAREVQGGRIAISVTDTGVGIPPEELQRIFDEFRQVAHKRAPRAHGAGLGLAIARRLTGLLQGELTVHSVPDVGSTFTLHLPLHPQPVVS